MGSAAIAGADGGAGTGSDGGAGGAAAGAGAAGAGAGVGAAGAGSGGDGGQFDVNELHPVLRNMSPKQITDLFETMAGAVQAKGQVQQQAPVAAQPAPKPPTNEEMKGYFDPNSDSFNPMAAFDKYVQATYAPMIGDINNRAIRGVLGSFSKEFPDFPEYQNEVMQEMAKIPPAEVNENRVLSTYFMLKGIRGTQKERAEALKLRGVSTLVPSPAAGSTAEPVMDDLEREVARKMFPSAADPIKAYQAAAKRAESGPMIMKVPMGGGKSE